jgi:hypothetical protein
LFGVVDDTIIDHTCIGVSETFFKAVDEDTWGRIFDVDVWIHVFATEGDVSRTNLLLGGGNTLDGMDADATEEFASWAGDTVQKNEDTGADGDVDTVFEGGEDRDDDRRHEDDELEGGDTPESIRLFGRDD